MVRRFGCSQSPITVHVDPPSAVDLMMFTFTILCLSFFISLVHTSPLAMRDVVNPHITSPDANTIWPVGTRQTVTWDTADLPPDSQLTKPDGKVVLGHLGPTGGLNLQLAHPLAQNFKLRDGKVQITVPNVAPRDDYIIVLFGDSGNTSPAFAITRITSGGTSSSSGTSSTPRTTSSSSRTSSSLIATSSGSTAQNLVTSASETISTPIPITGSVITGGSSDTSIPTFTTASQSSSLSPSAPDPRPTGSSSSAWSSHQFGSMKTFTIGIMSLVLMLAM